MDSKLAAFIEEWEGFTPVWKPDCGHEVIGIGHDRLPTDNITPPITHDQALAILAVDAGKAQHAVEALGWTLTPNQTIALVDFAFECGAGALQQLAAHGQDQVTVQLPRWIHAGGKIDDGMVKRRAAEVVLFTS